MDEKEKRFKIAEKGEFTKRALLNGKLDLVQAEAINDLVNSETQKQLELANSHIEGGLTNCVFYLVYNTFWKYEFLIAPQAKLLK